MSDKKEKLGCTVNLGFLNTVGVVFVVLKLLQVEPVHSWSWFWVLCPFWLTFALGVVFLLVFGIMYAVVGSIVFGKKK